MDNILKEVSAIWDKLNEIEKKLSAFTDIRHDQNAARITDEEEALCDLDEAYSEHVAELEEALCEVTEMMNL